METPQRHSHPRRTRWKTLMRYTWSPLKLVPGLGVKIQKPPPLPSSPIDPNSWKLAGVRVFLSGRHHECMADLEMTQVRIPAGPHVSCRREAEKGLWKAEFPHPIESRTGEERRTHFWFDSISKGRRVCLAGRQSGSPNPTAGRGTPPLLSEGRGAMCSATFCTPNLRPPPGLPGGT